MGVVTARYTFSGSGEDFGPRKGRRLVVLHTFENADPLKNTMRDAIAGATWQDRHDVLGSYNRIVAVDGVLGCVPDDRISGGMLAGGAAGYAPRSWLYDLLPAHVVNDGNSYALQLCAMGQRAYYDANGWPQEIIDGFAWSIIEEERAAGVEIVVANHADFQPGPGAQTRTDAGLALDLVMKRIPQLLALPDPSEENDMLLNRTWRLRRETWTAVRGAPFRASEPGQGVIDKAWSEAVEVTTSVEETVIVNGEITTPTSRVLLALYPDPDVGPELLEIPRRSLTNPRPAADPANDQIAALQTKIDNAIKALA